MSMPPSLPQRGRLPKGNIPLNPFVYSSLFFIGFFTNLLRSYLNMGDAPAAVEEIKNAKNILAPPCLGKALRRGTLIPSRFSWFRSELYWFMSVSIEPKEALFFFNNHCR